MTIDEVIDFVAGLDGVLTQRPQAGDGTPEIAWGDVFFYDAPDGTVPQNTQPFATIVTKDYPGDEMSQLDRPDVFRVNLAPGREAFTAHTGGGTPDPSTLDAFFAHPVYGELGWVSVNNPGPGTSETLREQLRLAHDLARARYLRRRASGQD
jgi:hypothetical protein